MFEFPMFYPEKFVTWLLFWLFNPPNPEFKSPLFTNEFLGGMACEGFNKVLFSLNSLFYLRSSLIYLTISKISPVSPFSNVF